MAINARAALDTYKYDLAYLLRPGVGSALRRLFDGQATLFDCETLKVEADFMLERMGSDKKHPHRHIVQALCTVMGEVLSTRAAA